MVIEQCSSAWLFWVSWSRPEAPAPLEGLDGLEGLLEVEEHEVGFEPRASLRHDGRPALLGGEPPQVDVWVRPLELRREAITGQEVCTKDDPIRAGATALYSPKHTSSLFT